MNRKQITNIDTAIKIYYSYGEIGNKEITELFGNISSKTIAKIKNPVKQAMLEEGVKSYALYTVNTKIAYKLWGIDIEDLESRRVKLLKLGLVKAN